jgi:hypothetical protein
MNEIGKNSRFNVKSKHVTQIKVKIKNKTLKIGFLEKITKMDDNKQKLEKIVNINTFKNI